MPTGASRLERARLSFTPDGDRPAGAPRGGAILTGMKQMDERSDKLSPDVLDLTALGKQSWSLFTSKPIEHIVASLIVIALGTVSLGILMGPLCVGQIRMIDRQRRGEDIRIEHVFSGFDTFAPAFLTTLIMLVGVSIGLLLLVVPGIALIVAWSFALWFVALGGASAVEALSASWALLKQNTASVLLVLLLSAVVNSLGASILFGTLLTAPLSFIFATLAFCQLREPAPLVR